MTHDPSFDGVGEAFIEHYTEVRGYIRQELVRRHLSQYLFRGNRSMQILDFGGGDGRDTIWAAEKGHVVTMLDMSEDMIERAQQNVAQEPSDVSKRITIIHGGTEKIPAAEYDLIMSHGVLMYELEDPEGQLGHMRRVLRDKGKLSLLTKGLPGAIAQQSREGNTEAVLQLLANGTYTNHAEKTARAYGSADIMGMLDRTGLSPSAAGYVGIRVLFDGDKRPVDSVPKAELAQLLEAEWEAGTTPQTRGMGQMLHFITHPAD